MAMKLCLLFAVAMLAQGANDPDEVRPVLQRFNEAVRNPDARTWRTVFTSEVDYRDASQTLKGIDAIVSLFTNRQPWSERTQPTLEEPAIRFVGSLAAFVDANLVQYGSLIGKSSVPVILLLEKEAGAWRISSLRISGCAAALPPVKPRP